VAAITARVQPELILLCGSRAWGTPHAESDYDVMVVVLDAATVDAVRQAASDARRSAGIPSDVIAHSVADYERRQNDPGFLSYMAARAGRVLFATGTVAQRSSGRVGERRPSEGAAMWIARAESDMRDAANSLAAPEPAWDAICFHSHACIEKLLKASIALSGSVPPRMHALSSLLAQQPQTLRDDTELAEACRLLDDLFPRSRYPELPEPTPDETRKAIAAARMARARIIDALSLGGV
jgi:HEPN domain-containing protein